ncbi:uncharacterized protein [Heterodontus francisci]|uniref:uncharacterized protein n=1 Tax=Heterodontus francisci TaxID=7792 RepID=UPI00355C84F8
MVVTDANGNKCGNVFVSTVISYSYFYDVAARRQTTDNYFGASVSCKGKKQREIMIDILCCQTWHKDISWAVCIGNTYNRKAFSFPPEVHSMAFNIYTPAQGSGPVNQHNSAPGGLEGGPIDRSLEICTTRRQYGILVPRAPCERCLKMFPDIIYYPNPQAHNDAKWEYGNCAECESLSQLLYANKQIFTGLIRENFPLGFGELINQKQKRLVKNLRSLEFTLANRISFYNSLE